MNSNKISILATIVLVLATGIPVGVMPAELDCSADYTSESGSVPAVYSGIVTVEGSPAQLGTEIDLYVDGVFIDTILTGTKWACSYPDGCELALNSNGETSCTDADAYVAYITGNDEWGVIQFDLNGYITEEYFIGGSYFPVDIHNPSGPVVAKSC